MPLSFSRDARRDVPPATPPAAAHAQSHGRSFTDAAFSQMLLPLQPVARPRTAAVCQPAVIEHSDFIILRSPTFSRRTTPSGPPAQPDLPIPEPEQTVHQAAEFIFVHCLCVIRPRGQIVFCPASSPSLSAATIMRS